MNDKNKEPAMTIADAYRAFPNSFKRRLLAGETLIGCWCSLANPITTEVLGVAGFDWLLLDGEHSPNDVTTFIPQLMALKDSVSAPVVASSRKLLPATVMPAMPSTVPTVRVPAGAFTRRKLLLIETPPVTFAATLSMLLAALVSCSRVPFKAALPLRARFVAEKPELKLIVGAALMVYVAVPTELLLEPLFTANAFNVVVAVIGTGVLL